MFSSNRHTAQEILTDNSLKNMSEHQPIVISEAKSSVSLEPHVSFGKNELLEENDKINFPEKNLSNLMLTTEDTIMLNLSHENQVENNFIQTIRNIRLFDEDEFVKSSDFLPDDFWNEASFEFRINEEFMRRIDFY